MRFNKEEWLLALITGYLAFKRWLKHLRWWLCMFPWRGYHWYELAIVDQIAVCPICGKPRWIFEDDVYCDDLIIFNAECPFCQQPLGEGMVDEN